LPPDAGKLLEAAAILHDIGHFVSNTGHQKHSAYLVANADMPGFTDKERLSIAALCRFHRKSMPQARHSHFQALDAEARRWVTGLAAILRIADSLDRGHAQKVRNITSTLRDGAICLSADAEADAELEIWSASEAGKIFSEIYALPLQFQLKKTSKPS
jgi:exopolyphosphatase/guanosine-5'-triphosphate,3'-diphosphate pyrophosphatase